MHLKTPNRATMKKQQFVMYVLLALSIVEAYAEFTGNKALMFYTKPPVASYDNAICICGDRSSLEYGFEVLIVGAILFVDW